MVVFEQYQIRVAVLDAVINVRQKTRSGGLQNVMFRNDCAPRPAKHFIQQIKPKEMSRLGAEHVVGHAKDISVADTDHLCKIKSALLGKDASIFAEGVEWLVALDVQVKIKPAAHIHGDHAEQIDPLNFGGIVVVQRKKVR
jgi:hypothetical protein